MNHNRLAQAWDIHVHATPSLFERKTDSLALVKQCIAHEMAGIVLKFHHGSSIEIAHALNCVQLKVYGGIVLNHFVGGLNTYAVDSAIALGAKIIWLPTMHAQAHYDCHCTKGQQARKSKLQRAVTEYLTCIDSDGELVTEVKEILELLDNSQTSLASGHISYQEILAIIQYIDKHKLNVNFLLNHVFYRIPDLTIAQLKQCIRPWVYFETAYLSISKAYAYTSAQHLANGILAMPTANWIMSTDSGQPNNPSATQSMVSFMEKMELFGLDSEQIKQFTQVNALNYLKN